MPRSSLLQNAKVDLTTTIEGQFSPDDWEKILDRAEARLGAEPTLADWQRVVREFHQERYWGFVPNYVKPVVAKKRNLGLSLIWMMFNSMVALKVVVLWFGQIYSRSEDPKDAYMFYGLLILVVGNYAYFLWRNRSYVD